MQKNKKNAMKIDKTVAKRLVKFITSRYKKHLIFVVICIVVSAIANVAGSLFLKVLIDNYIEPLLLTENPVFTGLLQAIGTMGIIYVVGIISTYIYRRIMAVVSQGVLKQIRDEMFSKMQTFPIKYFDIHTHGEIMSHYTNDTDTLSQMISEGLPQLISSAVTIIAVLVAMFILNLPLTIFVLIFVFFMLQITGKIASKSGQYFMNQQKNLAEMNGYIEEMISGQKVIKVFTHEEEAKRKFDEINGRLKESSRKANKYAAILMPILRKFRKFRICTSSYNWRIYSNQF